MTTGSTMQRLREERALSRDALAEMAGVSDFTIRRMEVDGGAVIRRSTLVALLTALHRVAPVEESVARSIAASAGITGALIDQIQAVARDLAVRTQAEPTPYVEARAALEQLIQRVGAVRAADMVRGMLAACALPPSSALVTSPAPRPQSHAAPSAPLPPPLVADHEYDGATFRVKRYEPARAAPRASGRSAKRRAE